MHIKIQFCEYYTMHQKITTVLECMKTNYSKNLFLDCTGLDCLNGGFPHHGCTGCICPEGFGGQFCETAGPRTEGNNTFYLCRHMAGTYSVWVRVGSST